MGQIVNEFTDVDRMEVEKVEGREIMLEVGKEVERKDVEKEETAMEMEKNYRGYITMIVFYVLLMIKIS